jgi:hypothetical protein
MTKMLKRFFTGVAVLLALTAATPMNAQAIRTFVASNGSDTNPCTRTQPCRNFAAAIAAVAPGGEVVVLDSAGYGPVSVTKSVSIVAPPAVHAAIAPTSGTAVSVGSSGVDVVLRGLTLLGLGANVGIEVPASVADVRLYLDSSSITGFATAGLQWSGPSGNARLHSVIARRNGTGLSFSASSVSQADVTRALVERVRIEDGTDGLVAAGNSIVNATDVIAAHHANAGFRTNAGGALTVVRSITETNVYGVLNAGWTYVSATMIIENSNGTVHTGIGASGLVSLGDNRVHGNVSDGAFTSTIMRR